MESHELYSRGSKLPSVSTNRNDDEILTRQGKQPQLKRNFGFLSMLGLTTTMLVSWEAIFFVNPIALVQAGPVGLLYGFIFALIGSLATAASLAEMTSMAPTSGGQYHWVALFAPKRYKVFLSWLTGWLSVVGWNAFVASGAFICAGVTQGLVVLNYPDYVPERWQATLILWAVLLLCVFVNTTAARLLPHIEGLILIIHVLGFFAILIPLTYLAPKSDASFVFGAYVNYSGWENHGVAWFIGTLAGVFPFLGYDGAAHMAEEVTNAAVTVPWCMVAAILINGSLAFAIVLAFLFTIGNMDEVLTSPTGWDFIQVFYNVTNSYAGSSAMVGLLIAMGIFATIGLLASTSRVTWAFARDNGMPFSRFFAKVHQQSALPLRAILLSTTISVLLALINIGSTAAFNALVSITVAGLQFSYFVAISVLLARRWSGAPIPWGPWRLGALGVPVNIFALAYLLLTTFFSFFPNFLPVTAANMNYSCVVFGAAVIFGLAYYWIYARHVYTGPIIEAEINHVQ